jgi:2-polyprenyl-3-methyl-5-hydroxy-6-metoxy-1,4-benzoquinol methylase
MNSDSECQINFPTCPVCSSQNWELVYKGPVRDGSFGSYRDSEIRRCKKCGIDRLAEDACLTHDAYQTPKYRALLDQNHNINHHYAAHHELAKFTLNVLWPRTLRGKTIADVGCGGGALLDHLYGISSSLIAIEPAVQFSDSLRSRGYHYFASTVDAAEHYSGQVDVVLSTQVIEHVSNPREFLNDIGRLLAPGGIAVVSTPNRRDILMELLPDDFLPFFYRTQHRWMFDAESLFNCAASAGHIVQEIRHVHRYGIANTMHWLNEKKPRGRDVFPPLDCAIDQHWQSWLESNGKSDNLYIILRRDK